MDIKKAMSAFNAQKAGAKQRGISWGLTFKEWCDFWGDDIHRRGTGHDKLQMQRFSDLGGYEIGNIKKGYPRDNVSTANIIKANKRTDSAHKQLQEALDRAMYEPSELEDDEPEEDDGFPNLGIRTTRQARYDYRNNH